MSPPRRVVRTTYDFFEDLDAQLGRERGPNGEPSTNDFQNIELLRIVDLFAEEFDRLPALLPGREDYRVLIATGTLVRVLTVVGQLAAVATRSATSKRSSTVKLSAPEASMATSSRST